MIRYTLCCSDGHRFVSWFRDSAAYDRQRSDGSALCPICGSAQVTKAVMSPAIRTAPGLQPAEEGGSARQPPEPATDVALLDERAIALRAAVKHLREKIMAETQDVGRSFPEKARKMHDGTIPMRQIRGQATADEAQDLLEDGVLVLPLPSLPEEAN